MLTQARHLVELMGILEAIPGQSRSARGRAGNLRHVRRAIMDEFGACRGWKIGRRKFSLSQLGRRSNRIRNGEDCPYLHRAVFYRETDQPYLPAAIVIPTEWTPEVALEVDAVRVKFGLHYEVVADFPSWYPGTVLVVYTHVKRPSVIKPVTVEGTQLSLF